MKISCTKAAGLCSDAHKAMEMTSGIKLKVCGMRDAANIGEVCAAGVDYMGFIFYKLSPRYVGEEFVMPVIPPAIRRVGVFVDEAVPAIVKKVNEHRLDFVQLHGNESPAVCEELRHHNIGIIKVFAVAADIDFDATLPYAGVADYFLFDTRGRYPGGNARTFDWGVLGRYHQKVPFFLSGGLGPGNIEGVSALANMNLHALDVNSGVEVSPGLKDFHKISTVRRILNSGL